MSALWVLALGASIGYLSYKKERMMGAVETAVKQYEEAGAKPSEPAPPDGAAFSEVKAAWRDVSYEPNKDFNERLPEDEKRQFRKAELGLQSAVQEWDKQTVLDPPHEIQGVYMESGVGAF